MRLVRFVVASQLLACLLVPAAGRGAPEASPPLAALLARHVPVLVMHPAEAFRPVSVEGFLADSDLFRKTAAGWEKVESPLPSGGAGLRLDQRLCSAREGVAATACYASAQAAHGASPVVYGGAFKRKNRVDLQYWLWYPFNPYSPTVPAGEVWQVHEGDWEAVSVILDDRGKPLAAGYSQHREGVRRAWAKVPKDGLRPRVYVALGSHANYFTPGEHRFERRIAEPLLIDLLVSLGQRPVDHAGKGRVIRPRLVPVTAKSPGWITFAGSWGEDQYLHAPGDEPVALGAGPTGPAFHEQWRAPVSEVLSWPRG